MMGHGTGHTGSEIWEDVIIAEAAMVINIRLKRDMFGGLSAGS
jgi:hypothetical protein